MTNDNNPPSISLTVLPNPDTTAIVAEDQSAPVTWRTQFIVLVCGFFAVFQTIGPNLSYGVFQDFYVSSNDTILPPAQAADRGLVAFVGTLAAGLTWGGSIYVNPMMARLKRSQPITITGSLLMSLGFLLASLSTQTWHLLLTQGLLYGIGSSMLYFPLITVAPEYFDRRRGAAMGIVLSAAGIGGLSYSLLIRYLLDRMGPRWTLRIMALENVLVAIPIALAARPGLSTTQRPTMVNMKIARKPTFVLQALGALLQAAGNFVPMTFTPEFSSTLGYTAAFGATLLAINNAVNAISRILTGVLADTLGRQNILVLSVIGSAISVMAIWMAAAVYNSQLLWVFFVVLYGVLAGGYMALFPVTITEVFGIQAYASVNGFIYFVRGLGAAFGSPVGGRILGVSRDMSIQSSMYVLDDYRKVIWYDGALLLGSAMCVIGVRGFDAVEKKQWKWKA